jgi:hypothetical protein
MTFAYSIDSHFESKQTKTEVKRQDTKENNEQNVDENANEIKVGNPTNYKRQKDGKRRKKNFGKKKKLGTDGLTDDLSNNNQTKQVTNSSANSKYDKKRGMSTFTTHVQIYFL